MAEGLNPHQKSAETKRRRTRAALLDAAEVEFSEQGWQARVEDVAQRAGVGVATAYNHFPSKISLMMNTFTRILEPFEEKVNQDIAAEMAPIFAVQRHVTELSHHLRRSHKNLVAAFLAASAEVTSNTMGPIILGGAEGWVDAALPEMPLANLIAYGQAAGVFRSESVQSTLTIGSYHTYAMLWMIASSPGKSTSSIPEFVLSQLLPAIRPTA